MFQLASILVALGLFAHAAIAQCDEWLPTPGDSSWIYSGTGGSSIAIVRAIGPASATPPCPPPSRSTPASAHTCPNSQATFTVGVTSNTPTYQWKIAAPTLAQGWTPLTDGPLIIAGAHVATVSGATTPTLAVQPSASPFATDFRCMIVNTCGSVETVTAHLSVAPCCGSADFNCDGDVGTDQDIDAFFACLSGLCPSPPCPNSADFNADGDFGTDQDIESFFRVLSGGPC